MTRRRRIFIVATDMFLMCFAAMLALVLRENMTVEWRNVEQLLPYMLFCLVLGIPLHVGFWLDRIFWRYSALPDFLRLAVVVCLTILGATMCMFIYNRMEHVSRSIPILQAVLAILFMVGARIAVRRLRWRQGAAAPARRRVEGLEHILVIGVNRLTIFYLQAVSDLAAASARIVGLLPVDDTRCEALVRSHRVFRSNETLAGVLGKLRLHGVDVDKIVITVAPNDLPSRLERELAEATESYGVRVEYLTRVFGIDSVPARGPARGDDQPSDAALPVEVPPAGAGIYPVVKRGIDITLAASLLVVLSPLLALVALVVLVELGWPAIFWQQRPGRFGRPFRLYKFRSMAEEIDASGAVPADEARVGALGALLRRSRLDELPQLWNILRGEMSFVGPRPLLVADQHPDASLRLTVRPGLTGLAQVRGGRVISARKKMLLDIWYVRKMSFLLDLKILFLTPPMLFWGERATASAVADTRADMDHDRSRTADAAGERMPPRPVPWTTKPAMAAGHPARSD